MGDLRTSQGETLKERGQTADRFPAFGGCPVEPTAPALGVRPVSRRNADPAFLTVRPLVSKTPTKCLTHSVSGRERVTCSRRASRVSAVQDEDEAVSNLQYFADHGMPHMKTYLTTYKVGDIVDIKANASEQKGMPHKYYHGKTGIVYNVTPRGVGVICYKVVNGRYMEKRVNLRVEHVKHSGCRQEFLARVKANAEKKKQAKADGGKLQV